MGYNLGIGEGVVRECMEERSACVTVEGKFLDEAPLNSSDAHNNYVCPSYTQWRNFAERVGLVEVFYGGDRGGIARAPTPYFKGDSGEEYDGLLSRHPWAFKLTEDHYRAFAAARERYSTTLADLDPESSVDYNCRRLEWLVWWTRWALDNCKYPTFYNS